MSKPLNIRVSQQRVLIQEDKDEPTTKGGLFVPETVTKILGRGVIVGSGSKQFDVAEKVVFEARQAMPIKFEGEEYLLVHESQICFVIG